nr:hypothetical protein [Micromonospora sp. DSM 115978]
MTATMAPRGPDGVGVWSAGPAAFGDLVPHQPTALELPQPLREQRATHPGDAAVDLVETVRTDHQLPDDQRSPPVAQDLDAH